MASCVDVDRVQYLCSCGIRHAFCRLYLCKHCLKLKCKQCVSPEVDTVYCPVCSDSMSVPEAKMRVNRCGHCKDCPYCGLTLHDRASSSKVPNPEDPSTMVVKRVNYMACGFCRWSTRDAGIPDTSGTKQKWTDVVNPHSPRIKSVLEYSHQLAIKEMAELAEEKYSDRPKHRLYKDKVLAAVAALPGSTISPQKPVTVPQLRVKSETVSEFPPLSDDFYSSSTALENVATMDQRLRNVVEQPTSTSCLTPNYKHLIARRSYRCKECEHNVSKPEYSLTSIKFKILQSTLNNVPEIRLMNECDLEAGKECAVVLTLTNMTIFNTCIKLRAVENVSSPSCYVKLPEGELLLGPCDHTVSISGDIKQTASTKDDHSVVVFKNSNKLGIVVKVTPLVESGPVNLRFLLSHEFRSTTVSLKTTDSEIRIDWLTHDVLVHLGEIRLA